MPELPEVQTTVDGLGGVLPGKKIIDVWSGYDSPHYAGKRQIKDRNYFQIFKNLIIGRKFVDVERRGKNILLHLSGNKTVVVHMKMTGHLLFGKYRKVSGSSKPKIKNQNLPEQIAEKWQGEEWVPDEPAGSPLWDNWNRHIRLVFTLSGNKHLVLSDVRKFAKVLVLDSDNLNSDPELKKLGPNPLEINFDEFRKRIGSRKSGAIKQVLMDQTVLAGIGNIYSDEALWQVGIHPKSSINKITKDKYKELFKAVKDVLKKGIRFSGDSTSDYRQPDGKKGNFQKKHNVYGRKGKPCLHPACSPGRGKKPACRRGRDSGIIESARIGGRTASYCPKHQKKYD